MSRRLTYGLVAIALLLAAFYLTTRPRGTATALAVYARSSDRDRIAFLFVESFDLTTHRAMPVQVHEVILRGPIGDRPARFTQHGDDPALLRVEPLEPSITAVRLRASNRIGTAEATVGWPPPRDAWPSSNPAAGRAWPVEVRCGERTVRLFSESGVPEIGVPGRILIHVPAGDAGPETAVRLTAGAESAQALFSSGIAIATLSPRAANIRARLVIEDRAGRCEASFLLKARATRTLVESARVDPAESGRFRLHARVRMLSQTTTVFGLLAGWSRNGTGPLLDARAFPVSGGLAEVSLEAPGPGLYQVRFTPDPLASGPTPAGVDRVVAAGDARLPAESAGIGETAVPETLQPFLQATLAATSPIRLAQVANTSEQARAALEQARRERDLWVLGLLGACLVALIGLMWIRILRAYRRSYRRLDADLSDLDEPARRIEPRRTLLLAALVAAILLAAVAALLLVLRTL